MSDSVGRSKRWDGGWVSTELGLTMVHRYGADLRETVGLALRRNPRRAHLLVSRVLGKHVPAPPEAVLAAGRGLGALVAGVVDPSDVAFVMGYCETATALGQLVADELGVHHVPSTRAVDPASAAVAFSEPHSHAPQHLLAPRDSTVLRRPGTVVLVDDELSTGTTVAATVVALQAFAPRRDFVVACLIDVRSDADAMLLEDDVVGARVRVVTTSRSTLSWARSGSARTREALGRRQPQPGPPRGDTIACEGWWPRDVPPGIVGGLTPSESVTVSVTVRELAARLIEEIGPQPSRRLHVLGTEELMYVPLLLADELATTGAVGVVSFSSTTRSPVVAVDDPGYAIRHQLSFTDGRHPGSQRFAYNIVPDRYDVVVVVTDATLMQSSGLLQQLERVAGTVLHLHVGPGAW